MDQIDAGSSSSSHQYAEGDDVQQAQSAAGPFRFGGEEGKQIAAAGTASHIDGQLQLPLQHEQAEEDAEKGRGGEPQRLPAIGIKVEEMVEAGSTSKLQGQGKEGGLLLQPGESMDADDPSASASILGDASIVGDVSEEQQADTSVSPLKAQGNGKRKGKGRASDSLQIGGAKRAKNAKRVPLKQALEKLIIQAGRKDPYSFFAEPVPVEEVPGYLDIVRHPMDFGTIRTRIESNHYTTVASFSADMHLVTSNAMLFNPPESAYHSTASRIANWLERAVLRECEDVVTPAEEEAVRAEELERQKQIERNLAMGLRPDGKPKRKKWRKGQITVPDNYVPAALRFGVDLTTAGGSSAVGSGPSTESAGTPRARGAAPGTGAEQKRDQSASRSVTPGRRGRVSASPFVSRDSYADSPAAGVGAGRGSPSAQPDADEDDDDEGAGAGTGAGGGGGGRGPRQRTMASHLRRRLAPRGSILRGRHSTSSTPRITAELVQQMEQQSSALPLSYLPDGSIDPSDIEDPASTLLGISADQMLPPTLESIVPIALEHVDSASRRKNPVKGLEATVLAEPGPIEDSYSHDLGNLPPPSQHTAFTLPGHLAGPWQPLLDLKQFGAPLRWPMAGSEASGGSAASSSTKSKVDPKNFDWSYNHLRPRLRRLLSVTDLGPFGTVVPARAVNTQGMLSEYNYLHGASLQTALLEELSASAGLALKIPGTPGVPKDLTHLIWTNMYRDYRPQIAQMLEAGAKGSDLLRNTVFGGAPGEAYARSVAEFVSGAARGVEERVQQESPELNVKSEAEARPLDSEVDVSRKRSASEEGLAEPLVKRVKLEEEEDAITLPIHKQESISTLDKPLVDWVRDNIMNPLTEGQLSILEQVAAGFAAASSAEELRHLEKELASESAPTDANADAEADADTEKENKEAVLDSEEQLGGVLDKLREALGERNSQAASPSKILDLYTATRLAESINDPTARMRLFELEGIQAARIDLSEMIVPDAKTPDAGTKGLVINKATGEQLYRISDNPDSLAPGKIDEALMQYGRVMQDVSKRIRDPDTKPLLEGLRKALLLIVIKKVEAKEMMPLPKHLITYLQGLQQQQQQGVVNPFAAANAAVKHASPVPSKT